MRWMLAAALALAGCGRDRSKAAPPIDSPRVVSDTEPVTPVASCMPGRVTDSVAGPLRLGMTVAQVKAACVGTTDTTRLADEGQAERVLRVPLGADSVVASVVEGRVWRIAVTSPALRTPDSLGVGTPRARLMAQPGAHEIRGEGRTFIVADVPCGVSFQVARDTVMRMLVTGCQ